VGKPENEKYKIMRDEGMGMAKIADEKIKRSPKGLPLVKQFEPPDEPVKKLPTPPSIVKEPKTNEPTIQKTILKTLPRHSTITTNKRSKFRIPKTP
jgi:hypothetical protein